VNAPNDKPGKSGRWRRPEKQVLGPNRSFGGYYRTSDRKLKGKDLRGVPLQTAEDAVVAAVRLGYQVVDAQIERGMNIAHRLRGAAQRAGDGDPASLLDNAERLISRGLLGTLEFLEAAAADPRTPIMRLLSAEFKMLGAALGLTTDPAPKADASRARHAGRTEETATPPPAAARRQTSSPKIRHTPESSKRAVTVHRCDIDRDVSGETKYPVAFHVVSGASDQELHAELIVAPNTPAELKLTTRVQHPAGRWRAAVCAPDGEQVGIVEIEL